GDSVFTQVNPLNFTMPAGGANPLSQILPVASTGTKFNFTVAVSTGTGGSWLTVTPNGLDCCATPEALTVSVTAPSGLAAGPSTGEFILPQSPSLDMSMTVPVTLTVAPSSSAFFDNIQGQLSFFMTPGGSTPAAESISIRNGGTGSLTWGSVKS